MSTQKLLQLLIGLIAITAISITIAMNPHGARPDEFSNPLAQDA